MEIGFEPELEGFAGAMDQGFGGGKGEAEDAGDFLVGKVVLAAKEDGQALFFGQGIEGLLDFGFEFVLQKGFRRGESLVVFKLARRRFVGFGQAGFDGLGGMARAAADFVEADVAGDGENPGGEFGGDLVAGGGLVNADEDDLGQVFRFGKIVQHAEHEADDGLFVFFHQLLEGAQVSVFGEEHERGIWVGRFGHQCKGNATPGVRQGCRG